MTIQTIKMYLFPAPSEKMKAGERLLLLGLLLLGLGTAIYLSGILGPEFYWGKSALFGKHQVFCPGCGGTRAFEYLLQGNLSAAWHYNQLFVLSLPVILYGAFSLLRAILTGYPLMGDSINPVWLWSFCILVILFGVLRNIPIPLLDFLRPPV